MAAPVALRRVSRTAPAAAVTFFVFVALAVGALATVKSSMAVALVVGAVVALVVARDVTALPLFLVFTMFVESLSLGPALRVGRIAGALALLVVVYYALDRGRAGLRNNLLLGSISAWGLWALASVYWADFGGRVFSVLASYVLGVAYTFAFALLVRRTSQLRWIYLVLAVGSLIFGLVAFVQYAGSGGGSTRAAGLQGDPNYFAVYQVIALAPTLVLAAFERRAQRRVLLYGIVGVVVLSVVSSLSRTGVIALIAVVLLTLFLPSRVFFARGGRKLGYILALIGAGIAAVGIGSTAFVSRVQSIFNATSSTGDRGAGRTDLWAAAWHGYTQHPWLGLGAGNFTPHALQLLQTTPGVDTRRNYITTANVVHNGYLEQLTELGPIGLALWLLILVTSLRYLIRAARRARAAGHLELERYATAAWVALVGYAVSVFFLSNELGKPIWIFAGLALALDVMSRRLPSAVPVAAGSYDDPVRRASLEDLERQLETVQQRLVADQERMDRRRAALDERERELQQRAAAPPPDRPSPQTVALEKLLRSRDATIGSLRSELSSVETALASVQADLSAVRAAVAERDELADSLRAQLAEARATGAERDALAESLRAEVAARDATLADLRASTTDRDRTVETLRAELADVRSSLAERDAAEEALRADVAARDQMLADLRASTNERDRTVETLRAELADVRSSLRDSDELVETLRAELAGLRSALQDRDDLAETLRGELTLSEQVVADLRASTAESEHVVQQLRAQLASAEKSAEERALESIRTELAARERALADAQALADDRDRSLAQLRDEMTELNERATSAETRAARGEAALASLEEELRIANQRVSAVGEARTALAAQVAALEQELAAYRHAPPAPRAEPIHVPAAEPEPVAVEPPPAPAPTPPILVVPTRQPDLEPLPRRWDLGALEAAAARFPDDPRAEEWAAYAAFLRDQVDLSGLLPASFDALVDEVYGDLIARVRTGA